MSAPSIPEGVQVMSKTIDSNLFHSRQARNHVPNPSNNFNKTTLKFGLNQNSRLFKFIFIFLLLSYNVIFSLDVSSFVELVRKMDEMKKDNVTAASWQPVIRSIESRNGTVISAMLGDNRINNQINRFASAEFKKSWIELKLSWSPDMLNQLIALDNNAVEAKIGRFLKLSYRLCLPPSDEQLDPNSWLKDRRPLPDQFGKGDVKSYNNYIAGYKTGTVFTASHIWDPAVFVKMAQEEFALMKGDAVSFFSGARDAWDRNGMMYDTNGKKDFSKLTGGKQLDDGGQTRWYVNDKSIARSWDSNGRLSVECCLGSNNEFNGEMVCYNPLTGKVIGRNFYIDHADVGFVIKWENSGRPSSISLKKPKNEKSSVILAWNETTGNLKLKISINSQGLKDGLYQSWYANGKIEWEVNYNSGEMVNAKGYYEDGVLKQLLVIGSESYSYEFFPTGAVKNSSVKTADGFEKSSDFSEIFLNEKKMDFLESPKICYGFSANLFSYRQGKLMLDHANAGLLKYGFKTDFSSYLVILRYIGYIIEKDDKNAKQSLMEGKEKCDLSKWPGQIIPVLCGDDTEKNIPSQIENDKEKMTEFKTYYGLHLYYKGDKRIALDSLRWVALNGIPGFYEYPIARLVIDLDGLSDKTSNKSSSDNNQLTPAGKPK